MRFVDTTIVLWRWEVVHTVGMRITLFSPQRDNTTPHLVSAHIYIALFVAYTLYPFDCALDYKLNY